MRVYIYMRERYERRFSSTSVSSCRKARNGSSFIGSLWCNTVYMYIRDKRHEPNTFFSNSLGNLLFSFLDVIAWPFRFFPIEFVFFLFFRSHFYVNSRYTEITRYRIPRKVIRKKIRISMLVPAPDYYFVRVRRCWIIDGSQISRYISRRLLFFSRHSWAIGQRQIVSSLKHRFLFEINIHVDTWYPISRLSTLLLLLLVIIVIICYES